jgi:hypothetical protein
VTLPPSIAVAMQTETTFESKQTEQRKRQEYDMKVLNDNNYIERVKQDRENERKKANEEAKKQRNHIIQEITTLEANMQKVQTHHRRGCALFSNIDIDGAFLLCSYCLKLKLPKMLMCPRLLLMENLKSQS